MRSAIHVTAAHIRIIRQYCTREQINMQCPERWTISDDEKVKPKHMHHCKFLIDKDHQLHICHCGAVKPTGL